MTRSLELRALSYAEKCQPRAAASFNKELEPTATTHVARVQLGFESTPVPVLACLSGVCGSASTFGNVSVALPCTDHWVNVVGSL